MKNTIGGWIKKLVNTLVMGDMSNIYYRYYNLMTLKSSICFAGDWRKIDFDL
jgi:hypothetical protein